MVWEAHDLVKVGLTSGSNRRDSAAVKQLAKYLAHQGVLPEPSVEWRAALPMMEGYDWGDCQRIEMVFATALKRRLGAESAGAVGLEWLYRSNLSEIAWRSELTAAADEALQFSGIAGAVSWDDFTRGVLSSSVGTSSRIHGAAQRDA